MWGCASIQVHMRRPEKKNGYPAWSVSSLFSEAGSFPEPGAHCWSDRLLSSKPNNPLSLPPATLGPQAHAAVSSFHAPIYFFYVYVCGFVHMHSGACRGQRGQISLEEELRTELWSSGRTVHALNHCALSSPCLASYGDAEVLNLGHACAGRILYPLSYLPVQHFFWKIIHVKTPHMNLFMQRSQKTWGRYYNQPVLFLTTEDTKTQAACKLSTYSANS